MYHFYILGEHEMWLVKDNDDSVWISIFFSSKCTEILNLVLICLTSKSQGF